MKEALSRINQKHRIFKEIRGMGLLIGAELVDSWQGRAKEFVAAALISI